jgi:hypothetical protein
MIYSAHCLEHFRPEDLESELRTLHRSLTSDGVIALEVPYGSVARMTASNHSPHLMFFSPIGLQTVLEKAGFTVNLCVTTIGRTRQGKAHVDRFTNGRDQVFAFDLN